MLDEPRAELGGVGTVDRPVGPNDRTSRVVIIQAPLDRPRPSALGGFGGKEQFDRPAERHVP